jgi:hypothetical protein
MQKIYLSILFCVSSSVLFAQFGERQKTLGGNLGLSFANQKTQQGSTELSNTSNGYGLQLIYGIGSGNSLKGIKLLGSYDKSTNSSNNAVNESYSVGLGYFTYKYKSLGKDFYLFGGFDFSASYFSNQSSIGNNSISSKSFGVNGNIGFTPGLAYFISKKLMLEISANSLLSADFTYRENKPQSPTDPTIKSANFGFSANGSLGSYNVGVRFLF